MAEMWLAARLGDTIEIIMCICVYRSCHNVTKADCQLRNSAAPAVKEKGFFLHISFYSNFMKHASLQQAIKVIERRNLNVCTSIQIKKKK